MFKPDWPNDEVPSPRSRYKARLVVPISRFIARYDMLWSNEYKELHRLRIFLDKCLVAVSIEEYFHTARALAARVSLSPAFAANRLCLRDFGARSRCRGPAPLGGSCNAPALSRHPR